MKKIPMVIKIVVPTIISVLLLIMVYYIYNKVLGIVVGENVQNARMNKDKIEINDGRIKVSDDYYNYIIETIKSEGVDLDSYYLSDNYDYFKKLVNAELVSQYPYIDGPLKEGEIKGIIHFERVISGELVKLEFIKEDEFNRKIAALENRGNEAQAKELLKYFTVTSDWEVLVASYDRIYTYRPQYNSSLVENEVYKVKKITVPYKQEVEKYIMPFEFLFALMQTTYNPEYVSAVADLALKHSEIVYRIQDITTINTEERTTYYNKQKINRFVITPSSIFDQEEIEEFLDEGLIVVNSEDVQLNEIEIVESNSVTSGIVKAKTWAYDMSVDYEEYRSEKEQVGYTQRRPEEGFLEEIILSPITSLSFENTYDYRVRHWVEYDVQRNCYTEIRNFEESITYTTIPGYGKMYDYGMFLGLLRNKEGEYNEDSDQPPEYLDKEYESDGSEVKEIEGKLVSYYAPKLGYNDFPSEALTSGAEDLFNLLQDYESTQGCLHIMKYFLTVFTGRNYGVNSASELMLLLNDGFYSIESYYGDSVAEKIWFALRNAGLSEIATAAFMGNLYVESYMDPTTVEGGGKGPGIGLCQWTDEARKEKGILLYAKSEGKQWQDLDLQISFILGEINPNGGANGFAKYQVLSRHGFKPEDWFDATSVKTASDACCRTFFRPGKPNLIKRAELSQNYYNEFKGRTSPSGGGRIGNITHLTGDNKMKMINMLDQSLKMVDKGGYIYSRDAGERMGPNSFDCSGFVYVMYRDFFGINVGSQSDAIRRKAKDNKLEIDFNTKQPGDIVWREGHVAIYLGNNYVVEMVTSGLKFRRITQVNHFEEAYRWIR